MNIRFLNFFYEIYYSFYSRSFYSYIYNAKLGFGLLFLLFLTVTGALPMAGQVGFYTKNLYNFISSGEENDLQDQNLIIKILDEMPKITIENAQASSDSIQPFYIYDENNNPIFVLDTNNNITQKSKTGALIIVNKNIVYIYNSGRYSEIYFRDFKSDKIELNGDIIRQLIMDNKNTVLYFIPFIAFLATVFSLIFELTFRVLVYSAAAFIIAEPVLKIQPNFEGFIRLAVYSSAPFTLIKIFESFFLEIFSFNVYALILTLVSLGYFIFALNAIAKEKLLEN